MDSIPSSQTPARELRDRLGVGLAVVVAAAGWALTLVVLVRGGGYKVVIVDLVPALPLAVIGTVTALAAWRRSADIAFWLALMVASGILIDLVVFWLLYGRTTWGQLVPPDLVWGRDFRDGLYDPARAFSVARSGWPPMTLLVGWPFTLVDRATAYALEVGLMACAAVGSAILSAVLAVRVVSPGPPRVEDAVPGSVDARSLGVVLGLWLITSYGFMYELQRGNVNLFALFFSLLAVWLAIRLPWSPWWPAVALAVAINLKLYPAILLVLLFWRYRLRVVVPVLVTNAVLLLIAGPVNFWRLLVWLTTMTPDSRQVAYGDMGASGTAAVLRATVAWVPSWVVVPLFVVPLGLWAVTAIVVMRRGWSTRGAVLLAAASVPPMAVVPTLSNDYKLVLFVFPLAVLAAVLAGSGIERGRISWCLGFGVLGWLLVFLARSSVFHGWALVGSKYSLAVLTQVVLLLAAWRPDRARVEERAALDEDDGGRPGARDPGAGIPVPEDSGGVTT
jgi:hypothetical protein